MIATRAPAAAKPRAIAPPNTPVPPVTTATLPAKLNCSKEERVIGPSVLKRCKLIDFPAKMNRWSHRGSD